MNRDDVEEGKRLLLLCGPIRVVRAVSAPPVFNPDEVGTVLENKAQGNQTYGYFSEEDKDDEGNMVLLIEWLLNHARDMVACADVAITGHITIPMLDTSESIKPSPYHTSLVIQAVGKVCEMVGHYPELVLTDSQYKPRVIELLRQEGISAKLSEALLRDAGYYP